MAIVKTVTFGDFCDSFDKIQRTQFSYGALKGLYEYYEQLSDDTGESIELDVIAICCDWTEYTLAEYNDYFDTSFDDLDDLKGVLDEKGIQYIDATETLVISNWEIY
jgi:hypothetical protein